MAVAAMVTVAVELHMVTSPPATELIAPAGSAIVIDVLVWLQPFLSVMVTV